ncbi:hypothetical protein OAC17_02770 [Flavobacteriaceae bacterium]|nr:hypothetical protein [Flavobacteriaceae bacterium]
MPKMNVIKSIYVDAAPEKIYPIINDLSNWEQWSPMDYGKEGRENIA